MRTRRDVIKLIGGTIGMMVGSPAAGAAAATATAPATPAAAARLKIAITAKEFSFDIPATVPAGLVDITMANEGQELHMAQIGRLNDGVGVTFDQFKTVLETKPQGSALSLFRFRGGPNNVPPGASQEVMNALDAGHYVLVCFVIDPDGVPHYMKGMLSPFEVVATAPAGPEPASDLTVSMQDFAYEMPDKIAAGRLVWKISNDGPEPHEFALLKLAPGVTAEQAVAILSSPGQPAATPMAAVTPIATGAPFVPAGGMQALDAGLTGWLVVDLTPGTYLAVCNVPDPKTGKPHIALGMWKGFTVIGTMGGATPVATPVS